MVLRIISYYGYEVFQAYPKFLPRFARWISLTETQAINMVQGWRRGATATAADYLMATNQEITTAAMTKAMYGYQVSFEDLHTHLLGQGRLSKPLCLRPAPSTPCGYHPPAAHGDQEQVEDPGQRPVASSNMGPNPDTTKCNKRAETTQHPGSGTKGSLEEKHGSTSSLPDLVSGSEDESDYGSDAEEDEVPPLLDITDSEEDGLF